MKIEPLIRPEGTAYWITAALFVCLLMLVWVKWEYPRRLGLLFRQFFTYEVSVREKGITLPAILLFLIYIGCLALLIVKIAPVFFRLPLNNEVEGFAILLGVLAGYYIAKTVVLFLAGFIFEEQSASWDYISEIYVFTHFSGIILLPVTAFIMYTHNLDLRIFGELICVFGGLLIVYRTVKMFIAMTGKGLKPFYLILYICSLEIVPLALFTKFGLINHLQ